MPCIPISNPQKYSLLVTVAVLAISSFAFGPVSGIAQGKGDFLPPTGAVDVPVQNVIFYWPAQGEIINPSHLEGDVVVYQSQRPDNHGLSQDEIYDTKPVQSSTVYYRLMLSTDSEMKNLILDTKVYGNRYVLTTKLSYGQSYFWRVMSVDPALSEWSAVNIFRTEKESGSPISNQVETRTPTYAFLVIGLGLGAIVGILVCLVFRRLRP